MKNQMMKTLTIAILAIGGVTVTATASETCIEGCTTGSTPMPMPMPMGGFGVNASATFSGSGGAVFNGQNGFANVDKAGFGQAVVDMNASGNLCGVSCQSGTFSFAGSAGEQVRATAGAFSAMPGVAATAVNSGEANAGVGFVGGRMYMPTPLH